MEESRANPFKSTQLRQWGFICYLGGHIVSRRERTDRLRRASDGIAPREPVPTADAVPRGTTLFSFFSSTSTSFLLLLLYHSILIPSFPLFYFTATNPLFRRRRFYHPPEKRIRRYTLASKFPLDFPPPASRHFSPRPSSHLLPHLRRSPFHFLSFLEIFDGKIWLFCSSFCIAKSRMVD